MTHDYHAIDPSSMMSFTGHPLILQAMEIFSANPFQSIKKMNGPYVVKKAIDQFYNVAGALDRKHLLCRGVYLYQEISLPRSHPLMANRFNSKFCNVAFLGMDENQTVRGFSRIKLVGTQDQKCMFNYKLPRSMQ